MKGNTFSNKAYSTRVIATKTDEDTNQMSKAVVMLNFGDASLEMVINIRKHVINNATLPKAIKLSRKSFCLLITSHLYLGSFQKELGN